jgi:hypothetical protein
MNCRSLDSTVLNILGAEGVAFLTPLFNALNSSTLPAIAFHSTTRMGSFNLFPRLVNYSASITRKCFYPISRLHSSYSATARPLVHYQLDPRSSSSTTMSSAASSIHDDLGLLPIDKWGWVIYRCTYADDEAWTRFRARVEAKSRTRIAQSDAPEIVDRLEWTWVSDSASLDGISTVALRERFRTWTTKEVARQQLEDYDPATISRFSYFIRIDGEVMQNLTGFLDLNTGWSNNDFVKFVDANWEPSPPEEQEDDGWEAETWEPIEDCTEKDVGWMCISPIMLNADFYDTLNGDDMAWHLFYERPPSIVLW